MTKPIDGHPIFRVPAEQRGYMVEMLDEQGCHCPGAGRPPAGIVLHNRDGDAPMWIPAEDLSAVGDLLIRMHVKATRLAVELR